MKIVPECVLCFLKQTLQATKILNLPDSDAKAVLDEVALMIPGFSFNEVPPEIAARIYATISEKTKVTDIFYELKQESIHKAREILPSVRELTDRSDDRLLAAAKAAVLGNVIDYGVVDYHFDLEEEMHKVFQTRFAIDDFELFRQVLNRGAKEILYIGDNAGENIFDELFIEMIKEQYPETRFTYLTRGRPIINDITLEDIKDCKIHEMAEVNSSGVPTPGLVYSYINDETHAYMEKADLIIAKGMGNFEALSEKPHSKIFFFFKIKCEPVAEHLDRSFGSIVCKLNV